MRVWLLQAGEPLPIDPGTQRLRRCGLLAEALADRGAEVIWWTSTFNHIAKTRRFQSSTKVQVNRNYSIWCLDARSYKRNVSTQRILANFDIAREFTRQAVTETDASLVFAAYPIPELAAAASKYAAVRGIPAIADVRDLWPDVWSEIVPDVCRPLADLALTPFYLSSRRTLRSFTAIYGTTDAMVDWGVRRAGRRRTHEDFSVPHAYPPPAYSQSELFDAAEFWKSRFGDETAPSLQLCFFGNLTSSRGRLDVPISAMRHLPEGLRRQIRLVICGIGEGAEALRASASDLPQVVFPGWVTGPQICALAASSDAGLLPYPSSLDFRRSIPNKAIEYLAFGLPILTSLDGPVRELIEAERCGQLYRETDPADLAAQIAKLFNERHHLQAMSNNAKRAFVERFSAPNVYGRLADRLLSLAVSNPALRKRL